jgi:hypothetical protein
MRFYIDFDEKGAAFRRPKGVMLRPDPLKSLAFQQLFGLHPRLYLARAIDDRAPLPAALVDRDHSPSTRRQIG